MNFWETYLCRRDLNATTTLWPSTKPLGSMKDGKVKWIWGQPTDIEMDGFEPKSKEELTKIWKSGNVCLMMPPNEYFAEEIEATSWITAEVVGRYHLLVLSPSPL